jgi:coatomer subunit beta'
MIGMKYGYYMYVLPVHRLFLARLVKVWDYHSKSCIQTLESHTSNVSFAIFHPSLPIIISGSEDGTVKIWHSNTYRLENTLSYALERAWCVAYRKGSNDVAVGFDEGIVVIQVSWLPYS